MNRRQFIRFASTGAALISVCPGPLSAQDASPSLPNRLRLQEPVNVLAFGVRGDGVADDTEAVQRAISGASMIFFPPGKYRVRSIALDVSGKTLFGTYKKSHFIPIGDEDTFVVRGSDIRFHDLMFSNLGTSRKSGAFIKTLGNFVHISRCYFENGHIGIQATSTLLTISDCDFRNFAARTGICIQINGGFSVMLDKIRADHPAGEMPLAGINITATGDTTISNSGLIHCGTDLLINPGAGKVVASIYASNTYFDTATRGIALAPLDRGAIVRAHFINCWSSSHSESGTTIDAGKGTVDGITFLNHQSNLNGGDGVTIVGTRTSNVQFLGGEMAQNAKSGIGIQRQVRRFYLSNIAAGAVHGLKGNDTGIHVAAECGDYQITACVCEGNRSGQIVDLSRVGIVRDNIGIVTRNHGMGAIPTGASAQVVNHGLANAPSPGEISLLPTSSLGTNSIYLDVSSIDQTTFTVRSSKKASQSLQFSWQARCLGA